MNDEYNQLQRVHRELVINEIKNIKEDLKKLQEDFEKSIDDLQEDTDKYLNVLRTDLRTTVDRITQLEIQLAVLGATKADDKHLLAIETDGKVNAAKKAGMFTALVTVGWFMIELVKFWFTETFKKSNQ